MSGLLVAAVVAAVAGGGGFAAGRASTARARRALLWRATHDPLTGLFNRAGLDADAARLLAAARPGWTAAALLIDLDGFKAVNDTYGHGVGDDVLRQAAIRLQATAVGVHSLAGRRGGDELALLVIDVPTGRCWSEVETLARSVHHALTAAYLVTDPDQPPGRRRGRVATTAVTVGASVGVGIGIQSGPGIPADAAPLSLGQLLAAADAAMYAAKRAGGGWALRGARSPGVTGGRRTRRGGPVAVGVIPLPAAGAGAAGGRSPPPEPAQHKDSRRTRCEATAARGRSG